MQFVMESYAARSVGGVQRIERWCKTVVLAQPSIVQTFAVCSSVISSIVLCGALGLGLAAHFIEPNI